MSSTVLRFTAKAVEAMHPGSEAWACPACPHVTIGKNHDQAELLAGHHARRHPGIAGAELIAEPATIAEFAFAIEVAAGQAAGRLFA